MSVLPTFHCFQAKQSSQKPPNICTDDLVWEVINKCVMKMDECLKFGFFKIINSLKTKAIILHVEKLREDLWQDHHRKPMSSFNANSEKSLNLHAWKLTRSQKDFYLVWLTRFDLFALFSSFIFSWSPLCGIPVTASTEWCHFFSDCSYLSEYSLEEYLLWFKGQ